MGRPKSFKLHGYKWKIKYDDSETLDGEDLGMTRTDTFEVDIATKNLPEMTIRDTLLHELLHVVMNDVIEVVKSKMSKDEIEEMIVRGLTPKIMQLFSDNKRLTSYIFTKTDE